MYVYLYFFSDELNISQNILKKWVIITLKEISLYLRAHVV